MTGHRWDPSPSTCRVGHFDAAFGISGDMALGALLDAGARLDAVNATLAAVGVPGLRAEIRRTQRGSLDCAQVRIRWDGDGAPAVWPYRPKDHEAWRVPPGAQPDSASAGPGSAGSGNRACGMPAQGSQCPSGQGHAHGGHGGLDPSAAGGVHPHAHRSYRDIRARLVAAPIAEPIRARALAVFARLAEAEGRVHGRSADDVHFHEVGGQDAIGDVVGVAAALEDLGICALTVSALPAGGGTVRGEHGLLPVPAPAVSLLLNGFDWIPGPVAAELVTPTGAAIVAALGAPAAGWPCFCLRGSGWGAGSKDFPGHPNACRFVWGEGGGSGDPRPEAGGPMVETLCEVETNLDDQTPEQVGYLYDRLFAAGALDVATSPLWMKKQRPGVRLWALVRPPDRDRVARCLFEESSALGLRVREVRRWSLPRSVETVRTAYGDLRIKVARLNGVPVNASPEYEDCRAAAAARGVPLKAVMTAALTAFSALQAQPAP